jgi:hypothetical protein
MERNDIINLSRKLERKERNLLVISIEIEKLFKDKNRFSDVENEKMISFIEAIYEEEYTESLYSYIPDAVFLISLVVEKYGLEYLNNIDVELFTDYFFENNSIIENEKEQRSSFYMKALREVINNDWQFKFKNIIN